MKNILDLILVKQINIYISRIASAAQSTISGSATSNFLALSKRTVTVTAKDSSGTNIGAGGDLFYIQITNECTKASNFEWTTVSGADNTIATSIFTEMTDNNDGTYSYSWTPDNEGKLSISAILFNRFTIKGQYYNTQDLSGSVIVSYLSQSFTHCGI